MRYPSCYIVIALLACIMLSMQPLRATQLQWNTKEFMGVEEIKAGMTGYGKTVFHGTKIETFRFVVLGLMRFDLNDDIIMVRITSGPCVTKKWNIIAGMSGSPMYINGRLIGAVAYGFSNSIEPIGGVMPIKRMMDSYEPGCTITPPRGGNRTAHSNIRLGKRTITQVRLADNQIEARAFARTRDASTMVMTPIATPVSAPGLSPQQAAALQQAMEPYNVTVISNAPNGLYVDEKTLKTPVTLEAGSAVSIAAVDGDNQFIATGTVTYRKGNVILAFGHPFSNIGDCSFGMYTAYIHGILPMSTLSMKMACPIKRVGAFTRDHYHCVGGIIGKDPEMIPVDLTLNNSVSGFHRKYHIEVAWMRLLTEKYMMNFAVMRPISELGGLFVDLDWGMYNIKASYKTDKYGTIEQRMTSSARIGGNMFPGIEVFCMLQLLLENQFEKIKLTKVNLNIDYNPSAENTGRIEQVTPDRLVAHPGETVMLNVKVLRYGGPAEMRQIPIRVPENTSATMMGVVVLGGAEVNLTRQVLAPSPTREEGAKGLIRFISGQLAAKRIVVAQCFPTPCYNMDGAQVKNMPGPLADVLPLKDLGQTNALNGMFQVLNLAGTLVDINYAPYISIPSLTYPKLRPTVLCTTKDDPLLLVGGQIVTIAIDNGLDQPGSGSITYNPNTLPGTLPAAQTLLTVNQAPPKNTQSLLDACEESLGYSPAERNRTLDFFKSLNLPTTYQEPLALPMLTGMTAGMPLPLSCSPAVPEHALLEAANSAPPATDKPDTTKPAAPAAPDASPLFSAKQASWGLTDAKDFVRGKHYGTAVSSSGRLTLVPTVSSMYRSTDFTPWKTAVSAGTVYLAGWGSNRVLALREGGQNTVVFPKDSADGQESSAVSALAVEQDGSLLIATWPDHMVRHVRPDGHVMAKWTVPCSTIWDIAVTTTGKRFAAGDNGTLYEISDNAGNGHAVCSVPDLHIYALAADADGGLYLATAPRGKIYHLSAAEQLTAIYEASGTSMTAVTSLVVDKAGNLYAGLSPSCSVLRIAKDGAVQTIMTGVGKDNKHVYALQMVGDDLYAATGLAGGIYRISAPASATPDVTIVYAREDLRASDEHDPGTGPESLVVTSLAATAGGTIYAATAFPAQLLKLTPRTDAIFVSPAMRAPAIAKWGTVDLLTADGSNANFAVESRSGATSTADNTWSAWKAVNKADARVGSTPATYMQFRIHLTNQSGNTPLLKNLRMTYQAANQPPTVKFTEPVPGAAVSGTKDLKWEASDPDGDALDETLFVSADGGKSWTLLAETEPPQPAAETKPEAKPATGDAKTDAKAGDAKPEAKPDTTSTAPAGKEAEKPRAKIANKTYSWDTKTLPDGVYQIKIVASDLFAKPADPKSAEAVITVTVDNTPPTVAVEDRVNGIAGVARLELTDALTPITCGAFRLDDYPWIALVPEDGVYGSKREWVKLIIPSEKIKLSSGEHKLTLQAKDAAGNLMNRTVQVVIP